MQAVFHYQSPLGGITMAGDEEALTGLWFDGQKYFGRTLDQAAQTLDLPVFEQTREWLEEYFRGEIPGSIPPVRLKDTPFRLAVWDILREIPYGTVWTYGEVARRLAARQGLAHMSAQAVGGAVGHNPVSILIPCHRVVGADGSLTGYAGGVQKKMALLQLEGACTQAAFPQRGTVR